MISDPNKKETENGIIQQSPLSYYLIVSGSFGFGLHFVLPYIASLHVW